MNSFATTRNPIFQRSLEGVYALVNSLVEVSKFCVLNEKLTIRETLDGTCEKTRGHAHGLKGNCRWNFFY